MYSEQVLKPLRARRAGFLRLRGRNKREILEERKLGMDGTPLHTIHEKVF